MRSVEEQLALITAAAVTPEPVRIAISEALGLRCAEQVEATHSLPGFDQAAIDGFAVRSVDIRQAIELSAQRRAEEAGAEVLVLGLPLRTDGKPSPAADRVRAFGRILQEQGYAVVYQDERFTTQRARARGAEDLDEAAAVEILQLWLASVAGF